jgi:hypothetical protein
MFCYSQKPDSVIKQNEFSYHLKAENKIVYYNETNFSYLFNVGIDNYDLMLTNINGIHYRKHFLGVGIGYLQSINTINEYYYVVFNNILNYVDPTYVLKSIPISINYRFDFINRKVTPTLMLGFGYFFNLTKKEYVEWDNGFSMGWGFYEYKYSNGYTFNSRMGIKINTRNKINYLVNLGIDYQQFSIVYNDSHITSSYLIPKKNTLYSLILGVGF